MPVKYIPFFPDTVEGQAILNNVTRTRRALKYRDNDKVFETSRRGMPFYEADVRERVGGKNEDSNLLIRGECISACAYLKERGITVDLVYIDPPFASGADYAKKIYIRKNPKVAEAMRKAEEQMEIDELKAFQEKMYGDIWNKEDYLNWMYENLLAIKTVMSDEASIYVHLDWHIGHYVKILLDEVFGEDNFKNEIIWCYSERGISKTYWNRKHDAIYFYIKNEDIYHFNPEEVRDEYSEESISKFKYYDDDVADHYQIRGKNIQGSPVQSADGLTPKDEEIYNGLTYRQYLGSGMLPKDWWEIPLVNKASNERKNVDYATQKPEALLERIIKASSNETMIVADFFGGSGVTAKVANDHKRKFIHVDVGTNSIQTTRDRLIAAGAEFTVIDIKDGVNLFRNPVQTMEKLATLIPGLQQGAAELSEFWFGKIQGAEHDMIPVYVPNLLDHTQKVLDIPLINQIINQELPELDTVKKAIVYYVDIDDEQEIMEFIRDNNPTEAEIELRDLKQVLDETVLDDIVEYTLQETGKEYRIEITKLVSDRLRLKINEYNQKRSLQSNGETLPLALEENGDENGNGEATEEEQRPKKSFTPIAISEEGLELIELISLDCTNARGVWKSDKEIKMDKLGYMIEDGKKTKTFWDATIRTTKKPLRMKVRNIAGDESIIQL